MGVPLLVDTFGRDFGFLAPAWTGYSFGFGLVLWLFLTLYWRATEAIALRTQGADRAFSDAPPGLVEYAVEVVIEAEGGCVGKDRGIVWFEDGLLTFNGATCSFAFAAPDVYAREKIGDKDPYYGLPRGVLRLRALGRVATVRFLPLLGRRLGFEYALGRFLASVPTSERPRQWPPLVPYGMTPKALLRSMTTPEAIGDEAARTGSAWGVVRDRTERPVRDALR